MRKRLTFSVALTVCLAVLITAAIFVQAQPNPTVSSNVVTYTNGGNLYLELPQGVPNHPVNLRISVSSISSRSDYGGSNVLELYIWVPTMNSFLPVAILSTTTNASAIAWLKSVVNGTPIWTPPAMPNYFTPTPSQLQVWRDGSVIMANLTASFNVTLPSTLGGNFTIPPMTLMFRPIASGFAHSETLVVPTTGWTITTKHTDLPAWVRFTCPKWVGLGQIETAGTIVKNDVTTYTPPAT